MIWRIWMVRRTHPWVLAQTKVLRRGSVFVVALKYVFLSALFSFLSFSVGACNLVLSRSRKGMDWSGGRLCVCLFHMWKDNGWVCFTDCKILFVRCRERRRVNTTLDSLDTRHTTQEVFGANILIRNGNQPFRVSSRQRKLVSPNPSAFFNVDALLLLGKT